VLRSGGPDIVIRYRSRPRSRVGLVSMSSAKRQRPASSSSSSSLAIDASLLECSICTHPFDEAAHLPRMLTSCGHTFCAACLASWVKQKTARAKHTITCPNDGQESEVKGGDVTVLLSNFGMLPLIAAALRPPPAPSSSSGPACELCEEKHDATHRCHECQQCMCDTLARGHRRQSGTMSHHVVSLAEWRAHPQLPAASATGAAVSHLCKSHGEPAKLFDLDCGLFLCGQCVLLHVDHAGRIKPVVEAAQECRVELDGWLGRCEHWDKRIAATDKACNQRGDEVQRAHGVAKDALEAMEKKVWAPSIDRWHVVLLELFCGNIHLSRLCVLAKMISCILRSSIASHHCFHLLIVCMSCALFRVFVDAISCTRR
jgi:hypothetical protein